MSPVVGFSCASLHKLANPREIRYNNGIGQRNYTLPFFSPYPQEVIMKVGIIGLPSTGKTTLFNALTHGHAATEFGGKRSEANVGAIPVPDARFDNLVEHYKPKKITPASIEVIDGAAPIGVDLHKDKFGTDFFTGIRAVDALIHIVRAFESAHIPLPDGGLNPLRDVRKVNDELMLADLALVETRLERIEKGLHNRKIAANDPAVMEKDLFLRIQKHLEDEKPLKELEFTKDEIRLIKSFDFLTLKPMIVIANVGEGQADDPANELLGGLREHCANEGLELVELAAGVEMEIAQLPEDEQKEYMEALGIEEPARGKVVRGAYRALGLISFFTVGEDEVRAWTLDRGDNAVEAAGKIHSDLARGFIRSETVAYSDFEKDGSWQAAKDAGHMRLEGKEYIMKDGDIITVRFKV